MNRLEQIGTQALWFMGHLLFTVIVDLTILGGYYAWVEYKASQPVQIDISSLSSEERLALSNALVDSGTSVPRRH
jgi:hypothetical protein